MHYIYLFPFTLLEITQSENTQQLSKMKKKVSQFVLLKSLRHLLLYVHSESAWGS